MTRKQLTDQIFKKQSYLCVGLDTDPDQLPVHLKDRQDGMLEFNRQIIEHTRDHCVAYKINTAFYEALGTKGWEIMEATLAMIPQEHFKIADAKRGDIGNTAHRYAKAFFETIPFDAVTVAPYMGEDSIRPFLEYENKWTIVLGLTSNKGAVDFEMRLLQESGKPLFRHVMETVSQWGTPDNLMFVTGATQAEVLGDIRAYLPEHFLLVPGVGFQGGSLDAVSKAVLLPDAGLLVNVSRAILYAGEKEDFATEAGIIAKQYQVEMQSLLTTNR